MHVSLLYNGAQRFLPGLPRKSAHPTSSTRPNHRLELKAVLHYSFPLNACFLLIYSQFIRFLHPCWQLARQQTRLLFPPTY